MRRRWLLSALVGTLAATGCLFKDRKRTPLAADKPLPPLPSALEKAQPPAPPKPAAAAAVATNTLPDTSEYKPVPIPAPPQPASVPGVEVIVPASAQVAAENPDDEKEKERKRLLERLREKRDERKEERKDPPKLPSAIAPKEPMKPTEPAKPADVAAARKLLDVARAKYEKLIDYEVHLVRREVVGGKESATEEVLFQFRKQPFSVYMRNVGEAGKGREVVYVDGKYDGLMHVVTGQGDNRLIGAGFKTSLKPDSPMATSKSRHKITEAGPGSLLVRLEKYVKAAEAGRGTVKSLGTVQRKDQPNPVEGIEIAIPPGDDPLLPKGGKWSLFFEPKTDAANSGNLMVNVLQDETGREVEYYCFSKWKVPANLTDADFSPDRLGGKKK
jgi:hypothetical protein